MKRMQEIRNTDKLLCTETILETHVYRGG